MALSRAVIALFFSVALLIGSCEKKKEQHEIEGAPGRQELLIGLIPEQNIFRQRERYTALRKYLSDRLGTSVNFTSLSPYGNIIERFTAEKMDGAFFGSFTYALARRQIGVEPIARPVNLDGTSTCRGYIFVRSDSGIRNAADMRGKRFAFVDHATTAGYLFPLAWFHEHGIDNFKTFLGEAFFAGSHDAAIQAVLSKEADIGAAKSTIYDRLAAENPRVRKELVILAASGAVPQNCLALRKDIDPELKTALRRVLLTMDGEKEGEDALRRFGARGFIETSERDYGYLYRLASKVGIHMKTYRYRNE